MTISSQVRTAGPYAGNGIVATFPFAFKVFQGSDLLVSRSNPNGSRSTLVLSSDFTAALNGDQDASPGGTITLLTGPLPTGYTLDMSSNISSVQPTALTNQGSFFPKVIERALDRLTILLQQQKVSINGVLRAPFPESGRDIPTAAQRSGKMLAFDVYGNPIAAIPTSDSAQGVRTDLLNAVDTSKNTAMIALPQGGLLSALVNYLTPEIWGASGDGNIADASNNALACMSMLNAAKSTGLPPRLNGGRYYLNFPIYLQSYTSFDLGGAELIFVNPNFRKGRGGIVMGSSYEANRQKAQEAYDAGTYPLATTNNPAFTNPAIGQYLRNNQSFVQAQHCHVFNGTITAYWDGTDGTGGGYAVNFVNAQSCSAHDLTFKGWTQAIGMGSDGAPETPSNYDCHAYNLHVMSADPVSTYYAIGFISNSTHCSIKNAFLAKPMTAGTPNGSGVCFNYTEDCEVSDIFIPNLGLTTISQGVLLQNTKRGLARNINVSGCRQVAVSSYNNASYLAASIADGNIWENISGRATEFIFGTAGKYDTVRSVASAATGIPAVYFMNVNATGNVFTDEPQSIGYNAIYIDGIWFCAANNLIKGWRNKTAYLRPSDILSTNPANVTTIAATGSVRATAGNSFSLGYQIPQNWKGVTRARMYIGWGTNSLTAGTNCTVALRRLQAFNGNVALPAFTELSGSAASVNNAAADGLPEAYTASSMVVMSDATNGRADDLRLEIQVNNPVGDTYAKAIEVSYWG